MTSTELLHERKLNEEVKADLNKIILAMTTMQGDHRQDIQIANNLLNSTESNLLMLEDMLYDKQH